MRGFPSEQLSWPRLSLAAFGAFMSRLTLVSFASPVAATGIDPTTPALPILNAIEYLGLDTDDCREPKSSSKEEDDTLQYDASFPALSGGTLGKRQDEELTLLTNNVKIRHELRPGETRRYRFSADQVRGVPASEASSIPLSIGQVLKRVIQEEQPQMEKRQRGNNVFITLAICRQPSVSSGSNTAAPPALSFYVSSEGECTPGPGNSQNAYQTEEGLAKYVGNRSDDVCVAVSAPDAPGLSGSYTFEVAASIDAFYTNYFPSKGLHIIDTDSQAGMFITTNLTGPSEYEPAVTDAWMASGSPFSIFIHHKNDTRLHGLKHSYCGINDTAVVRGNVGPSSNDSVEVEMTTLSPSRSTITVKQQFYVSNLYPNSEYVAYLGLPSNYSRRSTDTPTGGGTIWEEIEFNTTSMNNCQIIYNLDFCSDVAYAVPSNGTTTREQLKATYDDYAEMFMRNFNFSLEQIPCDTEDDAQYSLATNCTNCTESYKKWLCAVTIPRCADFSAEGEWLTERNVLAPFLNGDPPPLTENQDCSQKRCTNGSRNPMIDEVIRPGPYKEILPCGSLCYGLVQACPAALGFTCPDYNDFRAGFNLSYYHHGGTPENPHCNMPGAVWGVSAASVAKMPFRLALFVIGVASVLNIV